MNDHADTLRRLMDECATSPKDKDLIRKLHDELLAALEAGRSGEADRLADHMDTFATQSQRHGGSVSWKVLRGYATEVRKLAAAPQQPTGRSGEAGDYAELLSVMDGLCDLANDKGAVIYNLGAKSKAARETVRRLIAAPANPAALFDVDWIIRHLDSPETAARSHHRGVDAIKHVANRLREKLAAAPQQPTGRSGEAPSVETLAKLLWERFAADYEVDWPSMDAGEYRSVAGEIAALYAAAPQQPTPVGDWRPASTPPANKPGTWSEPVAALTMSGNVFRISYMAGEDGGVWQRLKAMAALGSTGAQVVAWTPIPTTDQVASLSHQQPPPVGVTDLQRAYQQGWYECANWAKRADLKDDVDSPEYAKQRDKRLSFLSHQQPAPSVSDCPHEAWEEKGGGRRCSDCREYLGPVEGGQPAPVSEPAASGGFHYDPEAPGGVAFTTPVAAGGERLHTMTQVRDRFGMKQPDPKPSSAIPHADAASGEGLELADDLEWCAERCDVYSPDQVATLIDGIGWIAMRHKLRKAAELLRRLTTTGQGDVERLDTPAFLDWAADEIRRRDTFPGSFAAGVADSLHGRAILLRHVAQRQEATR